MGYNEQQMNASINKVTEFVRSLMFSLAKGLNAISGGMLTPDFITWIGFLAHVPIAILIAQENNDLATLLLIVFGLFDALDGALAKVQHKASSAGMVLDATTDRMKEVMVYAGAAYALSVGDKPETAFWAVLACGASLCVSYVKAKGETAVKAKGLSPNEINRLFSDGIFRFQVRMLLLIIGLLGDQLVLALAAIAIGSTLTAFGRLFAIRKKLRDVQS